MFVFIKKKFFTAITIFSCSILNVNSLECVSLNNQECKIRSEIIMSLFLIPIALE